MQVLGVQERGRVFYSFVAYVYSAEEDGLELPYVCACGTYDCKLGVWDPWF